MRLPSALNAELQSALRCPSRIASGAPVLPSHSRAVWSAEAVTMHSPSALNAALTTTSWCPSRVAIHPMLYRGMDRSQLDAAYNNTAAVPERGAIVAIGGHAVQRCGANTLVISTLPRVRARASGSICS
jgi:hypothetical protein